MPTHDQGNNSLIDCAICEKFLNYNIYIDRWHLHAISTKATTTSQKSSDDIRGQQQATYKCRIEYYIQELGFRTTVLSLEDHNL
eukprot:3140377-Amphidinium_carterae.1